MRYLFVREGDAWKVDDIAGGAGDDKWDLRDIIKPGARWAASGGACGAERRRALG